MNLLYKTGLWQAKHMIILYKTGLWQAKHMNLLYKTDLWQAKHMNLLYKTNRLMVYGQIIAVSCEVTIAFTLEQVPKTQRWSRFIALLFL